MPKPLAILSNLISSSNLSLSDQNDLLVFLPALPTRLLEDLVIIFKKNPKLINDFNDNFKSKLNVLINGRDHLEKLINQEEEMFEEEKDKGDKF